MEKHTEVKQDVKSIYSEDFFDLMQNYRIAPLADQSIVIMHFDNVKKYIAEYVEQEKKNAHDELVDALINALKCLETWQEADAWDENDQAAYENIQEALKKANQ